MIRIVVLIVLAFTGCAPTTTSNAQPKEPPGLIQPGRVWSYAHVQETATSPNVAGNGWHRPDAALERAGLPQIVCRLLDVVVTEAESNVRGWVEFERRATFFVKLEVHWRTQDNPAAVSLAPAIGGPSLIREGASSPPSTCGPSSLVHDLESQAWPVGYSLDDHPFVYCKERTPECASRPAMNLLSAFTTRAPRSGRHEPSVSHGVVILAMGSCDGSVPRTLPARLTMRLVRIGTLNDEFKSLVIEDATTVACLLQD